jgi:hypothetical protein
MQVKASNHLKLLWLRVTVVSVKEKVRETDQVGIKETNASEPLNTCRKLSDDVKTGGWDVLPGSIWELPAYCPRWRPA